MLLADIFDLDVVAATKDDSENLLMREASARWKANGSGRILNLPQARPISYPWEGDKNITGMFPPQPNEWSNRFGNVLIENTDGPIANDLFKNLSFRSDDG